MVSGLAPRVAHHQRLMSPASVTLLVTDEELRTIADNVAPDMR